MTQWIKDLTLSLLWLRLLLWRRFNPWPRNFHTPWVQPKQANKKKKVKRELTEWEKIFANKATDKGLIFKTDKHLMELYIKKKPIKKWA